jgi:quinoprotein glucose dehydrogenase
MICLDAKTGKPCQGFGIDGAINLRAGVADEFLEAEYAVTSPPAFYKDLVIVGAAVPEYPSRGQAGSTRI